MTEKKYRRKQIYTAFIWAGDPSQIKAQPWGEEAICNGHIRFNGPSSQDATLLIDSKCGPYEYTVNPGDWIIYGSGCDLSSCKPYFFDKIYEEVP